MPSVSDFDRLSDYSFTRAQVRSTTGDYAGLGPLSLSVPTSFRNRKIYCGVYFRALQQFGCDLELGLYMAGQPKEVLSDFRGYVFTPSTSVDSWSNSSASLGTKTGFPVSVIEEFDPRNFPSGTFGSYHSDSIRTQGTAINSTTGLYDGYAITMTPHEFVGQIDEVRFQFKNTSNMLPITGWTTTAFVEVYLGCKSS